MIPPRPSLVKTPGHFCMDVARFVTWGIARIERILGVWGKRKEIS